LYLLASMHLLPFNIYAEVNHTQTTILEQQRELKNNLTPPLSHAQIDSQPGELLLDPLRFGIAGGNLNAMFAAASQRRGPWRGLVTSTANTPLQFQVSRVY
jgi:hypothetical protein